MTDLARTQSTIAPTKRLDFSGSVKSGDAQQKPERKDQVAGTNDDHDRAEVATAAELKLNDMSVEALKRLRTEIDRTIREKEEALKKAIINQIVEVVKDHNVPVDELVRALGGQKTKRTGVKVVQKYQDPDTGATWSGRGREPTWIRGRVREDFRTR